MATVICSRRLLEDLACALAPVRRQDMAAARLMAAAAGTTLRAVILPKSVFGMFIQDTYLR